jgi:hypothetical protein
LPDGASPPDICIEIALWDRFPGWGPEQTDKFTLTKLRILFAVLEQQKVTRDATENLGRPSQNRYEVLMAAQKDRTQHIQAIEIARKQTLTRGE